MQRATGRWGGGWTVAYDAGTNPTAGDFLSFGTAKPFVFAEVIPLTLTASNALSYDMLRDIFLPVTNSARQNASAQGFLFTDFKWIRDQALTFRQGGHRPRATADDTNAAPTPTF